MIYRNQLSELRESKRLNKKDMAKLIAVHPNLYGQYELENALIPTKHLNTICNFFQVSFDYVLNFTIEKSYQDSRNELDKNIIRLRLKEFRKSNNLTQDKLAKILNVERSTIANYENGRNLIALPFLYTICKKYKISADYLLGKIDQLKYFE